jgi:HemK-like putative methylase
MDEPGDDLLVARLRAAGCVFAEEEAAQLRGAARDVGHLEAMTARRAAGEFLEHVLGSVEVMGERLAVAPGVFVPRRRTALLIRETVRAARARPRPRVLEMCAPVAALVARRVPGALVHAADADAAALAVARENLPPSARLHLGAGWDALPAGERFDVIAAVPPYVPRDRFAFLPREAREHEPTAALLGGEDGLDPVRSLLAGAADRLAPGGVLLLEMHRGQCGAAGEAARATGRLGPAERVLGADGSTAVLRVRALPAPTTSIPAATGAEPATAVDTARADLVLLRRVRDRIDREHDRPLDVEALAAGVHLSAGHLSRRFREEYGESPYSYLMTRRIERAMTLLRSTDRSVTDICMDVGFSSLGTFSTRFKELVGVPPSTYRARGAEVLDGMPPCIARRVTRPVRNREARGPADS